MSETIMRKITLKGLPDNSILHNQGCGISYVQRNAKIPFDRLPEDCWFLKENLARRIAVDIPWSRLEPEEGRYLWDDPEWEGCFRSWVNAGFRVVLKVRGMDTLGTLYNQGTPQWVFDAGAGYVDEPIEAYRSGWLLNDIPSDRNEPIRYPVYWDPVYLEKAGQLIHALGERYNRDPAVESVAIGHMGRWGEMHIAADLPLDNWIAKGYSIPVYTEAFRRIVDLYRSAFPDKELLQSICPPSFRHRWPDAVECLEYLAEHKIVIKYDGLGRTGWTPFRSPFLDSEIFGFAERFRYRTKLAFENLVLPEALQTGLDLQMSYWHRGGEGSGLRELLIDKEIPIREKKLFSFYRFFPEKYDALSVEAQKELFRKAARECGYRIGLRSVTFAGNPLPGKEWYLCFEWENRGKAPCYENFNLVLVLERNGSLLKIADRKPLTGCGPAVWRAGSSIVHEELIQMPDTLLHGSCNLLFALEFTGGGKARMNLDNENRLDNGFYPLCRFP